MEIVNKRVDELKLYSNNPRDNDKAIDKVANSIKEFGFKVPIIIDKNNTIVAGHTRIKASVRLGLDEVPCVVADDLTDKQIRAFRIADNRTAEFALWDMDLLADELSELEDMDYDIDWLEFDGVLVEPTEYDEKTPGSLTERFIAPPFSVLDTRQGYWQDRKKKWLDITGNLSTTRDGKYGKVGGGKKTIFGAINNGTSNFDPVLAELLCKWFNKPNGKILDPFGGEQTKGIVAGVLECPYHGVEIRQEQVELNRTKTEPYKNIHYYCGDSNNISKIITDRDFDFCYTSPPYYDLEVYSEEDMSALGTYDEFMEQYRNIFEQCYDMLADDRFLVVKVAEIRDKKTGEYRNFVRDNLDIMGDIGLHFYNEIILINAIGTAPIRANNSMRNRKIVKVHQNILVFYKGDIKTIQSHFPSDVYPDDVTFDDFTEAIDEPV